MTPPLTIGSLFSGIGGLELGLEWAGLGPVLWQVEINPHARAVLAAYWPEVTRYDDVQTVGGATLTAVDLVCGGFPCQDVSSAGKRLGLGGARSGLWFEFRRIVSELHPQWVVVENVASGARAWVDCVSDGLAELGYAVLPVPIAAADVGAPHARARVFLVAVTDADDGQQHAQPEHAEMAGAPDVADAYGTRRGFERATQSSRRTEFDHGTFTDVERDDVRLESGRCGGSGRTRARVATIACELAWRSPIPDILRMVHGLSARVDATNPRIRALGNAVVPQCAEVVGHVIQILRGTDV